MLSFNIPRTKEFLRYVTMQHRDAAFLWGEPGCGKTDCVRQLAAETNAFLVDIRLAQYDSVDLRGFPGAADGRTVWYVPSTLPFKGNEDRFPQDRPIIVFLDEANAGNQAVFAVAMQFVHERRIGEHTAMDNVVIIAAGNREGDRGVANRMPTTLSNRFTHLQVVVDVDAYCHYRQTQGALPVEIAFYQFRKNLLSTFDPSKPEKAFATPRSCEKAWKYYADPKMPDDIKRAAMAGTMGEGPTMEAWGFIEVWQNVTPVADILRDPKSARLPEEASLQYATAVSVSSAMTSATAGKLHAYLKRMPPEFAVLAWQLAVVRDKSVAQNDAFIEFGKQYKVHLD